MSCVMTQLDVVLQRCRDVRPTSRAGACDVVPGRDTLAWEFPCAGHMGLVLADDAVLGLLLCQMQSGCARFEGGYLSLTPLTALKIELCTERNAPGTVLQRLTAVCDAKDMVLCRSDRGA